MSTRTTLVLLAVLILVGIAVYFIEYRKPGGTAVTPAPSGSTTLFTLTSPAIDGITVRDVLSGTQVSATRDVSGTWWLASPAGQPADPTTMRSVALQVSSIYVQRTITPTGSLDEFGFLTPTLKVDIASVSGPLSFVVGDMTPSKGAYYAQKPGDTHVYLIDTGLVDQLRNLAGKPPIATPPTPAFVVPTPAGP